MGYNNCSCQSNIFEYVIGNLCEIRWTRELTTACFEHEWTAGDSQCTCIDFIHRLVYNWNDYFIRKKVKSEWQQEQENHCCLALTSCKLDSLEQSFHSYIFSCMFLGRAVHEASKFNFSCHVIPDKALVCGVPGTKLLFHFSLTKETPPDFHFSLHRVELKE